MVLFETDIEALGYLEKKVLARDDEVEIDISKLKEPLYDKPKELSPGHYEFEGKQDFKVSFDLVNANDAFSRCWVDLRQYHNQIEGKWNPIFAIQNLVIKLNQFYYNMNESHRSDNTKIRSIYWPSSRTVINYIPLSPGSLRSRWGYS